MAHTIDNLTLSELAMIATSVFSQAVIVEDDGNSAGAAKRFRLAERLLEQAGNQMLASHARTNAERLEAVS